MNSPDSIQPVLSVSQIHKSFQDLKVHQGVSFDLFPGEILALLGGSGTGKSLLLRSLIGLEKPDSGDIFFENQNLTLFSEKQWIEIRKKIAYVFQNGALFDSLTVEENLQYPLEAHTPLKQKALKKKVQEALAQVNLDGTQSLFPNELSGGMQKRVGLARATILDPEIILFDEPTAGLDPSNTKRLIHNIQTLKEKKCTGIFVTHDIPCAFQIADRIAVLYEGKILCIDSVKGIQKSKDPIVQSFIGEFL